MTIKQLIEQWFNAWNNGNFRDIPVTEDFQHTSPFGTIEGKKTYLNVVEENREKFLGYTFEIHDAIYEENHACVRYTARQGADFSLDVSEWYYLKDGLIGSIVAYYHIGEIRGNRELAK